MGQASRTSLALFSAVLLCASSAQAQEGSTINLGVGTQKAITVPGLARMAIGDPSIVDVRTPGGNQVLLIGRAEGKTSVVVFKTSGARVSYVVVVRKQAPNSEARLRR